MEQDQEPSQQCQRSASDRAASHGSVQGTDSGTNSATARFPLLRRLSITSLAAMLLTATILVLLYRQDQLAEHEYIATRENERAALHLMHMLGDQIPALISTTEGLDAQALRASPSVGAFAAMLEAVREHHIVKLKIFNLSGVTIFTSVKEEVGSVSKHPEMLAKALHGETAHAMNFRKKLLGPSGELNNRYIVNTYMPLAQAGKRIGAIEIYTDATPVIERISSRTITIALIVLGAFSALYAALFYSVLRTDRADTEW